MVQPDEEWAAISRPVRRRENGASFSKDEMCAGRHYNIVIYDSSSGEWHRRTDNEIEAFPSDRSDQS